MSDVTYDPYDLGADATAHRQLLADRIFPGPLPAGERLVDDDDRRPIGIVSFAEAPPHHQRNPHRLEVAGRHHLIVGRCFLAGLCDAAGDRERERRRHAAERMGQSYAAGPHAREDLHALRHLPHEGLHLRLLGVSRARKRQAHDK